MSEIIIFYTDDADNGEQKDKDVDDDFGSDALDSVISLGDRPVLLYPPGGMLKLKALFDNGAAPYKYELRISVSSARPSTVMSL